MLVVTLFIPKEVHTQEEMKAVAFGYPLSFFVQDFSRFTPMEFPQKFIFGTAVRDDPAYILWDRFIISYSIIFAVLNLLPFVWRKMPAYVRSRAMKQALIFFLSGVILVATLFIPKEVYTQEEMKSLVLGYPFGFYVQDFSRYSPLEFPQQFNFGSPWEDPAYVLWGRFIMSYLVIFIILNLLIVVGRRLRFSS